MKKYVMKRYVNPINVDDTIRYMDAEAREVSLVDDPIFRETQVLEGEWLIQMRWYYLTDD